jgi:lysozyme
MTYYPGCDISSWEDNNATPQKVDFEKMKQAGAKYVGIRATFGTGIDDDFSDFWQGAKTAKIPRMPYIFLTAHEAVQDQVNAMIFAVGSDLGELPPVVDFEQYKHGLQYLVPGRTALQQCLDLVESYFHKTPVIYTGYYIWRDNIGAVSSFSRYPLWIANYAAAPMVPAPWTKWTFWQYTDRGDGAAYGTESAGIDLNYYNGDESQFKTEFGIEEVVPDPIPTPAGELRFRAAKVMNIRSGPGLSYPVIGLLQPDVDVIPLDVAGGDAWIKTDKGWACKCAKGTTYLNKL